MAAISYERVEVHLLPSLEGVPLGFWENRVRVVEHPEFSNIFVLPDRAEAARFAAEKILDVVSDKPDAAITLPSSNQGNSVLDEVVRLATERNISFADVHVFHLDEYFPITADDPESFRKNIRERFVEPLNIPEDHFHQIKADPGSDGDAVAAEYETLVADRDIDILLHPIGCGGHMAFDEKGTPRDSLTHLADLSPETVYRDHVERHLVTPEQAITQGIGTIKRAKKILFINFDPKYQDDMRESLYGPITEDNPSSLLREVGSRIEVIVTRPIFDAIESSRPERTPIGVQ